MNSSAPSGGVKPSDAVAAELVAISEQLDKMAASVRSLTEADPPWSAGSMASDTILAEAEFEALPYRSPGTTALVYPLMSVGHMQDHLSAFAVGLRTPRVVMSLSTLMRTYLTAAAEAYYLSDTGVNRVERMRRVVNADLKSLTELMNMAADDRRRLGELTEQRRAVAQASRKVGWAPANLDTKRKWAAWPDCWVGNKPLSDMARLRQLLRSALPASTADNVFRTLSASTHAQPHALAFLIDHDNLVPVPSGGVPRPDRPVDQDVVDPNGDHGLRRRPGGATRRWPMWRGSARVDRGGRRLDRPVDHPTARNVVAERVVGS